MTSPSNLIVQTWQSLRTSLWFVPLLIVSSSILLAFVLISANGVVDDEISARFPKVFGAGAAGSRGLLTAVATSMITVAGVTFSITIVVLSLASNQYSPRILGNFMRDRFNQSVLGTFLGIYAYCLIVVRTIRDGDSPFVPSLAVLGSLLLALVGVVVLIGFIHHIIASIQAGQIISLAADETVDAIEGLFPDPIGESLDDERDPKTTRYLAEAAWLPVPSRSSGYLCRVDGESLIALAERLGAVIRMEYAPGDFCVAGAPLVSMALEPGSGPAMTDPEEGRRQLLKRQEGEFRDDDQRLDALSKKVAEIYLFGRNRSIGQDVGFGILQVVDIALKALSPGMNETTTAINCIHYLTVINSRLATQKIETRRRAKDGALRVIATKPTFVSLLDTSFDEIRRNAEGNVAILEELLRATRVIGSFVEDPDRRLALRRHVKEIAELAARTVAAPSDRASLEREIRDALVSLGHVDGATWSMGAGTSELEAAQQGFEQAARS